MRVKNFFQLIFANQVNNVKPKVWVVLGVLFFSVSVHAGVSPPRGPSLSTNGVYTILWDLDPNGEKLALFERTIGHPI